MSKFECAGQSCNAPSRIYVHDSLFSAFTEQMVRYAASLTIGNGLDPKTQMGPVTNHRRIEAMTRLTQDAIDRGGEVVTGGKRIARPGFFWEPTILINVPHDAAIFAEEPFGPLLPILPYSDLEEALALANSSHYGLAGYGFTTNPDRAEQIIRGLEVGYVGINQMMGVPKNAPVQGIKASGYGLEGGLEGIQSYLYPKLVTSKIGVRGEA